MLKTVFRETIRDIFVKFGVHFTELMLIFMTYSSFSQQLKVFILEKWQFSKDFRFSIFPPQIN